MLNRKRSISLRCEKLSDTPHPEYQNVNTRVSEYLIKYGQGKIDSMPTDTRSEVQDNRSVDEMLDDPNPEFNLGTEELDALLEFQSRLEDFKKAELDIKASQKERISFENAMKVLDDPNASGDAKRDAYKILQKLEDSGKLSFD